ncbi:MAG: ImmA/IrrE family metallo-endopeptidase [Propionibacteriaceae bacterium]|jgi:hypothetical protein|nr:ImmA/IrrE family metallo-endopeptidase [Propionibacteriaceae bacterium]
MAVRSQADDIYPELEPVDDVVKGLIHSDRTTPELSLIERQLIVSFAQMEALRLTTAGVVLPRSEFPLDVVAVANRLGVDVKSIPMNQLHPVNNRIVGFITKEVGKDGATIFVDSDGAPERSRFTIAHELGHYVTWRRKVPADQWTQFTDFDLRSVEEGDIEPQQFCANTFAHKLLIPDYALATVLQQGPSVDTLAGLFGVSTDSIRRRMTYIDLSTQSYPMTLSPA